jgi:hypothetical protein
MNWLKRHLETFGKISGSIGFGIALLVLLSMLWALGKQFDPTVSSFFLGREFAFIIPFLIAPWSVLPNLFAFLLTAWKGSKTVGILLFTSGISILVAWLVFTVFMIHKHYGWDFQRLWTELNHGYATANNIPQGAIWFLSMVIGYLLTGIYLRRKASSKLRNHL